MSFDKYVVAHAVIESESDHTMDVAEEMIMCIDQSATSPELENHKEVNQDQIALADNQNFPKQPNSLISTSTYLHYQNQASIRAEPPKTYLHPRPTQMSV